jgi:hypothetical protein
VRLPGMMPKEWLPAWRKVAASKRSTLESIGSSG